MKKLLEIRAEIVKKRDDAAAILAEKGVAQPYRYANMAIKDAMDDLLKTLDKVEGPIDPGTYGMFPEN